MAYIDKISCEETGLSQRQFDLVRRILRKNLAPDNKCSSGVFIRVARLEKKFLCTDEDKLHLAFAREAEGTSRVIRAINHLAEMEGVSGRLIDNAKNMNEDNGDSRNVPEFMDEMSAMSSGKPKVN